MTGITGGNTPVDQTQAAFLQEAKETTQELAAESLTSKGEFQAEQAEDGGSVVSTFKNPEKNKRLEDVKSRLQELKQKLQEGAIGGVEEKEETEDNTGQQADQFQKKNPQLKKDALIALRKEIKPGDSKEKILEILDKYYPKASKAALADEALNFLFATSQDDPTLAKTIQEAKTDFIEANSREINAGRKIESQIQSTIKSGSATKETTKDVLNEVMDSRDPAELFKILSDKNEYKDLDPKINSLLSILGAGTKVTEGPSSGREILTTQMAEIKALQAIKGVYRFFKSRDPLVEKLFDKAGIPVPPQVTFENISKAFMAIASERHPDAHHVQQTAKGLGLENSIFGEIIVFQQMRDGVRQMARNILPDEKRNNVLMAILTVLEDLEDQADALSEEVKRE